MSKTNYLQAVISDLQRTAGPYSMCHDAHSLKYRKDYRLVPRQRRSTEELNALSGGPACVAYD